MIDVAKFSIGWSWGREEMLAVGSQVSGRRTIWSIPTNLFQPSLSIFMFHEAQNHNHIMKPKIRPKPDATQTFFKPSLPEARVAKCWGNAGTAFPERSGSFTKGRTPNIRYFVAKLSIVAIYALFERLSQGFQRKPSCFRRVFKESHLAFVELSTKSILLS